jgi:hypothetical protein
MAAIILSVPFKLLRKTSPFTKKMVLYYCMTVYFNNGKANKRLGYKVEVSMKEVVYRSCKVCCCVGA